MEQEKKIVLDKNSPIDPGYLGHTLLGLGFRKWFLYMFRMINGTDFIVEPIHERMFEQFQNILDGHDSRCNMNMCPRSAKTTMAKYFVAYGITKNPRSQFIYTSFSQELLMQIANEIAGIMQHPVYKAMYTGYNPTIEALEADPVDDFWREYLWQQTGDTKFSARKIITPQGGIVLMASIGSAITGFGAGRRDTKGFAGALICFPYDEQVWTEKGRMAIGDIVKNKTNVRVWSYNFKTKKIELRPVTNWITNPGDDLLEISWNGASFRCTPDHKVWTLTRGYVSAKDLRSDDVPACLAQAFNLVQSKSGLLYNNRAGQASVHYDSENIVRQLVADHFLVGNALRKLFERFARLDIDNRGDTCVVSTSNNTNGAYVSGDIDNVGTGKIGPRKHKRSNLDRILHILGLCSVSKVFQTIVKRVRVNVTNFNTRSLWTNKGMHNGCVNHHSCNLGVFRCAKAVITTRKRKVDNFARNDVRVPHRVSDSSAFTADTSPVRNTISPFIPNNGQPLLVRKVGHIDTSYCLTIGCNHNMIVGKTQGFLVKNCDDANKPADIRSETMRKRVHNYFVETLFTRLNSSDTPVVNIQQRLHIDDLTGYLESVYGFKTFKYPLIDSDGNCTLPEQYTPQRVAELQKNPYTFASQYQQSPVLEGGNLIKTEWFNRYVVPPTQLDSIFIVADTAFSEKQSADYSAFGLFGTVGEKLYMLGGYVKRVIFPDLCRDLTAFYKDAVATYTHNTVSAVYIEAKGSGISLIQQLRQHGLPISELSPTVHNAELKKDQISDKYTRLMEVSADLESGYVYIPEQAHWLNEFLTECEAFTGGKQDVHDDFVDVLIYALKIRRKSQQTDWTALTQSFLRY